MPWVLVLAGLVLLWLGWVGVASVRDLSPPVRQKLGRTTLRTSVVVVLLLVLLLVTVRFGVHWIAAASALLLALLSRLPVVVRAWLLFKQWRQGPADFQSSPFEPTQPPNRPGRMTREEALKLLGVADGASDEQILRAYRQLMKKVHPDQGGSAYLAAKLNEAKNVLLK